LFLLLDYCNSYSIEKEKLNSSKIKIIKEEERQRIKKNYNKLFKN
jgi:hypothetical protein